VLVTDDPVEARQYLYALTTTFRPGTRIAVEVEREQVE
jgi:hypothetical protein